MRVMFAGDIHGNVEHMRWLGYMAYEQGCDTIVACGDFGYWPHLTFGKQFLREVEAVCEGWGLTLYWVDGNHENHDMLQALRGETTGVVHLGRRTIWVPRGQVFELGELRLIGHGGAYSVDWEDRMEGVSWWRGETISEGDLMRVREQVASSSWEPVDIAVTHEAPLPGEDNGPLTYKDEIPESWAQRERLSEIVRLVEPSLVFCGHHHRRASFDTKEGVRVNVLGRDDMGGESFFVMDMTKDSVAWVRSLSPFMSVNDGNEMLV